MIELIKISDTLLNDLEALVAAEPDALKRQTMQLAYHNLYHVRHFFRHLINLGQLYHDTTVTLCEMTDDPLPSHSALPQKKNDNFQLSARVQETAAQDDEALKNGLIVLRGMKSNGTKTYAKKKMDKNCIFGVNSFPLEIRQTRV